MLRWTSARGQVVSQDMVYYRRRRQTRIRCTCVLRGISLPPNSGHSDTVQDIPRLGLLSRFWLTPLVQSFDPTPKIYYYASSLRMIERQTPRLHGRPVQRTQWSSLTHVWLRWQRWHACEVFLESLWSEQGVVGPQMRALLRRSHARLRGNPEPALVVSHLRQLGEVGSQREGGGLACRRPHGQVSQVLGPDAEPAPGGCIDFSCMSAL